RRDRRKNKNGIRRRNSRFGKRRYQTRQAAIQLCGGGTGGKYTQNVFCHGEGYKGADYQACRQTAQYALAAISVARETAAHGERVAGYLCAFGGAAGYFANQMRA